MLYGENATDPMTFAVLSVVPAAVALMSCFAPNPEGAGGRRRIDFRAPVRAASGWQWLDDLTCDARYACRLLMRRDRASSIAAVVMLALAISLNGIVFTIADAMLVRGFPLVKDNAR